MVIDMIINIILVLCIAYNIIGVVYVFKIKFNDNLFTIAMSIGMIVFPLMALCANICCKG